MNNAGLTRVIGIGRPGAGDDGVGLEVARALQGCPLPAGIEVHEIGEPERLIGLLAGVRCIILIDALSDGAPPGTLSRRTAEELAALPGAPLSSHGLGVAEAIRLARTLAPAAAVPEMHIIGVSIAAPTAHGRALTSAVAAAVPRARRLILELLGETVS